MIKSLSLLVLMILVFSSPVVAQVEDAEFRNTGDFRVRYFNFFNLTGTENSQSEAEVTGRLRWNLGIRKGENLQAYLGVLHHSRFGDEQSNTGDYSSSQIHNQLLVNRAWGWWKASEALSFRVGRFGIAVADGAVFSENDWETVPTAHEGGQIIWDLDFAVFNFFAVKTHEGLDSGDVFGSDPERSVFLLSADLKNMPEAIKAANLHFAQMIRSESDADPGAPVEPVGAQNLQHFGVSVSGDVRNIMYKLSGAYQAGVLSKVSTGTEAGETDLAAHMIDVMLGYMVPEWMGLTISAKYHRDSGDDNVTDDSGQTYQAYYYDFHRYAGLMDVVRLGNLSYWSFALSGLPMESLEVGINYFMFFRTVGSDPKNPFTIGDENGGGSRVPADRYAALYDASSLEEDIGSEIDIYAERAYDSGLKIRGRFGAFLPGDYLERATPPRGKTILQAMLQAEFAF